VDSILNDIKNLKLKKEEAQTKLTRLATQIESLEEQRTQIVEKLESEFGVSVENVEEELSKLGAERDRLLSKAKEVLDRVIV
jgi:chromosome segregation ATPase